MFDKKYKAYHEFPKKVTVGQLEDVNERINLTAKINKTPTATTGATLLPQRLVPIGVCTIAEASRSYRH